ncbi:MAG: hypothetical protein K2I08_10290 [Muribaculaceae bacterium]|nr:hypothetical protein [Muribaculaceae bacterium]
MKKLITLSISCALAFPLFAESLRIFKCTDDGIPGQTEPQLMGFNISANGRYVCGTIDQGAGIFIANCLTGDVKWQSVGSSSELRGVDDNGLATGFVDDDGILFSFHSNDMTQLKTPEGVRYVLGEALTNDGSLIVGSYTSQSFNTMAAYSPNGDEWLALPYPTDEELGNLKEHISEMSAAKYVSADGKVILGHVGSFTFPIIWKLDDSGNYVPDCFPARYIKAAEEDLYDDTKELYGLSGLYTCMSNNGKYVGAVGVVRNDEKDDYYTVPVIYNTEEKTLRIYRELMDIDEMVIGTYPRAIANDGTFIGAIGLPLTGGAGTFIMRAGEDTPELFIDAFPEYEKMLGESDMVGFSVPTGISADGKQILGYAFYSEDLYGGDSPAYFLTYVLSIGSTENGVHRADSYEQSVAEAIYSIDGRKLSQIAKGLNIIRNADGSVSKILRK